MNPLEFEDIHFRSTFAGRVLAQSGQNMSITLNRCAFESAAEEPFVDGMLSKMDKNLGLIKICFMHKMPFHSEQNLVCLMMSEYGPIDFSHHSPHSPFLEEVLGCLHNSPGLQSLELNSENFAGYDDFARFMRSLKSTSLRQLTIRRWNCIHVGTCRLRVLPVPLILANQIDSCGDQFVRFRWHDETCHQRNNWP